MTRNNESHYRNRNGNNKFNKRSFLFLPFNQYLTRNKKRDYGNDKQESKGHITFVKYGTWSDRIGVLVNIAIGVFTIFLFRQSVRQNTIAEKNIEISDSVFRLSKRVFDSSLASEKFTAIKAKEAFDIQNRLVNSQIQSFEDNRKQFNNENDADIRIDNNTTEPGMFYRIGKPISKKLTIATIGVSRVTIESVSVAIQIRKTEPTITDISQIVKKDFRNMTISQQNPFDINIYSTFNLTRNDSLAVDLYKTKSIYVYGKIIFANQVINKRKEYYYVIQIGNYPWINYIYNIKP